MFCLFSLVEGLPNVVAEAMLCECIPVVTRAGGVPDMVGDNGYFVKHFSGKDAVNMVAFALIDDAVNREKRMFGRHRIMYKYHLKRREIALKSALNHVIKR